jgi:hypothetical protein
MSYEFRNGVVRAYPGGWHSAALDEGSEAVPLGAQIPLSQDEAYIERTYRILSGCSARRAGWRGACLRGSTRPGNVDES